VVLLNEEAYPRDLWQETLLGHLPPVQKTLCNCRLGLLVQEISCFTGTFVLVTCEGLPGKNLYPLSMLAALPHVKDIYMQFSR
jgi:hypothetical protein